MATVKATDHRKNPQNLVELPVTNATLLLGVKDLTPPPDLARWFGPLLTRPQHNSTGAHICEHLRQEKELASFSSALSKCFLSSYRQ